MLVAIIITVVVAVIVVVVVVIVIVVVIVVVVIIVVILVRCRQVGLTCRRGTTRSMTASPRTPSIQP